ncbi:MAG: bifunctional phosphoglucose/phosphomannose isomerase [Candidatus Levybacteria bacterium]|nr:bifunctional phosphoglucose/phosphomannose isomerase [Candidatus Levybacteria bacterium]
MNPKDPSNFRQFIIDTPTQFKLGMEIAKNAKVEGDFKSLTVSGMGGSALPVNLLQAFINTPDAKPLDIYINRYYSLPPYSKQDNSLNFISSYSGTTEEAISSLEEVHSLGLPFVGFSSGGNIEELSKKYGMPHVKLPIPYPNYQPRMGTGYFFGAMYQTLVNHGLIPDKSEEILANAQKFMDLMDSYEQKGKELAQKLKGKTPVVYASSIFASTAMVWKIKLNENAKTPAFYNFFPELNHNEMVGFTNPQAQFFIIMLKDLNDDPRNLKRYEVTAKLLKDKGIDSEIIEMHGDNVFSKMFLSITLADWASYYLALEYDQDPTPVAMVEDLKKILAS